MLEFIRTERICFRQVEHTKLSVQMTDRNIWFSETLYSWVVYFDSDFSSCLLKDSDDEEDESSAPPTPVKGRSRSPEQVKRRSPSPQEFKSEEEKQMEFVSIYIIFIPNNLILKTYEKNAHILLSFFFCHATCCDTKNFKL